MNQAWTFRLAIPLEKSKRARFWTPKPSESYHRNVMPWALAFEERRVRFKQIEVSSSNLSRSSRSVPQNGSPRPRSREVARIHCQHNCVDVR